MVYSCILLLQPVLAVLIALPFTASHTLQSVCTSHPYLALICWAVCASINHVQIDGPFVPSSLWRRLPKGALAEGIACGILCAVFPIQPVGQYGFSPFLLLVLALVCVLTAVAGAALTVNCRSLTGHAVIPCYLTHGVMLPWIAFLYIARMMAFASKEHTSGVALPCLPDVVVPLPLFLAVLLGVGLSIAEDICDLELVLVSTHGEYHHIPVITFPTFLVFCVFLMVASTA
ncbi:unnamed protein product [Vitrella brassicaformis CCMP3155]|uniref:Dolichol kinase n=1 Tax=Vitrella brassicaformis (strain CCMP3155) TaxID=1169540 RepID=A0A0G4H060_VITBC|nr:unnamed protein product [Vitrella brassicaformis CCMP3155]|eukprot:CEM36794.1 unnamed protein product [Vitrella brassicaformis CCMP3155]